MTDSMPKFPAIAIDLSDLPRGDGDRVISAVERAMKAATEISHGDRTEFLAQAQAAGGYDEVLNVTRRWVNVTNLPSS